ncbi:hypothetical protein BHE74_00020404 [Ensete ventricosum]|nr:hypothetical protein BHE74_00020404 [Ensete ventricosum]
MISYFLGHLSCRYADRPVDRRRSISAVGGRLREKSTVGGRLSEKKGRRRRREKEEKKKRGEEERPSACTPLLPAGRQRLRAVADRGRFFSRAGRKIEATLVFG